MRLKLPEAKTGREIFSLLDGELGFSCRVEGPEAVLKLPERVGRGSLRSVVLGEGLEVFTMDCVFAEDTAIEGDLCSSLLELNFCLAGWGRGEIEGGGESFDVRPGDCGLFIGPPGARGGARYAGGKRVVAAEVRVLPPLLGSVLGRDPEEVVCPLGFPAGPDPRTRHRLGRITPEAARALRGMLECPYGGRTRLLYLEAKALELLALALGETEEVGAARPARLRPDDEERVRAAAELLVENMEDPPSLVELARRVALNDHKLKVGFREVFATTAFGYLKERRLERARALLEEGALSVGEVAARVGYANQSRFAEAFRLRFGVRPSSLLPHGNGCRKASVNERQR